MKKLISNISLKLFVIAIMLLPSATAVAQCPMCKMSAESSDVRAGLNPAILYLLVAPIVLLGGAYGYWYMNREKFENHS